ncbi:membrane protein [Gordonia Phage SchottB]|nr:membrane protein [Gordonia Phage SchottB]
MSGYRPRPAGRWRGSVPPPGGAGVARPGSARELRDAPRIAALVRIGAHAAWITGDGQILKATSSFWTLLRGEDPDLIEVKLSPNVTPAAADRVAALVAEAEKCEQERVEHRIAQQTEAHLRGQAFLKAGTERTPQPDPGEAEFVDWGSSTPAAPPDAFTRMFRALAAFLAAVPRTIRAHPRAYFGVGVPVILIATGQVGAWLAAIDWAVVVVSTLIVLAGVFVVALSVSRRNYRREIADQQAALAERAQKQHEEWLKE